MSQEPRQYLTYEEALRIAKEITQTPSCELDGVHDARGGDEPATGYIVHYWPLQEDGSRKRYLMVVEYQIEWDNLKRIALAHEAKRQRQRERSALGGTSRSTQGRRSGKPGKQAISTIREPFAPGSR